MTEPLEGSSALEAVMAYGEVEEKVEEDVLDIGKNEWVLLFARDEVCFVSTSLM